MRPVRRHPAAVDQDRGAARPHERGQHVMADAAVDRGHAEQLLEIVTELAVDRDRTEIPRSPVCGGGRQRLGRRRKLRLALGDQRPLPFQALELPGAEPDQHGEAEQGQDGRPEARREAPARGVSRHRRAPRPPTTTPGESAWRRTLRRALMRLLWCASECSPLPCSIEGMSGRPMVTDRWRSPPRVSAICADPRIGRVLGQLPAVRDAMHPEFRTRLPANRAQPRMRSRRSRSLITRQVPPPASTRPCHASRRSMYLRGSTLSARSLVTLTATTSKPSTVSGMSRT